MVYNVETRIQQSPNLFPSLLSSYGSQHHGRNLQLGTSHLFDDHDGVDEAWAAHDGSRREVGANQLQVQRHVLKGICLRKHSANLSKQASFTATGGHDEFERCLKPTEAHVAVICKPGPTQRRPITGCYSFSGKPW